MRIKTVPAGMLEVNCYIVSDDDTKEAIVIDPGGSAELILSEIKKSGVKVVAVIDTHGHADHIAANDEICEATSAPLYIHKLDAPMLSDARQNLSAFMGFKVHSRPADGYLAEGDEVKFGNIALKVIETPGHSLGSISLYGEGAIFSGDVLFSGSIGRTDFPGGSFKTLTASIKEKLYVLPDETQVFSGHGPMTTIGEEKRFNPFVSA